MLNDLPAWWLQQMVSLLPKRARFWSGRQADTLFIEPAQPTEGRDAPAIVLSRRRRRADKILGRFTLDGPGYAAIRSAVGADGRPERVVLRVPPSDLLERQTVLPLAAERGVGQILLHDMDRLTPFRADEVYWSHAIESRDRARGRLHVRLSLVPRAPLGPLFAKLSEAGIEPSVIESAPLGGATRGIVMDQRMTGARRRRRRAIQAGASACAALAVLVLALPFALQAVAIGRTEQLIADLQPGVTEAEALRRRIASETSGASAMNVERARVGDAVAALYAVTDILPDSTYLSSFELSQRQITLSGQSTEAARLISALSNDPAIRNPSFAAPVTRTGRNGGDLFSIRAELAP